jgi:hypothetical protein
MPHGSIVYVVMGMQPTPGDQPRAEAGDALDALVKRLETLLVRAGRTALAAARE